MNTEVKLIKNKLELLNLAEELGNVSQACKVMDYSRGTFIVSASLYDKGESWHCGRLAGGSRYSEIVWKFTLKKRLSG